MPWSLKDLSLSTKPPPRKGRMVVFKTWQDYQHTGRQVCLKDRVDTKSNHHQMQRRGWGKSIVELVDADLGIFPLSCISPVSTAAPWPTPLSGSWVRFLNDPRRRFPWRVLTSQGARALGRGARASWLLMSSVMCTSPPGTSSGGYISSFRRYKVFCHRLNNCFFGGVLWIGSQIYCLIWFVVALRMHIW